MTKGDIVIVPIKPCMNNDVINLLGSEGDQYPVYAIVRSYDPDDPVGVLTEVYTEDGEMLTMDWWFKDTEVQVLEEAPEQQAQDEVYALGA